jgi:phasin
VNEGNLKADANANPVNANTAKLSFEIPLSAFQGMFRGFAEQGAARAKENCETMKAASEDIARILREACSTNARGAADYGTKMIEISSTNTSSALEFLSRLADIRSLTDIVNLSTTQSRKSLEAASAQHRELWELAQNVATETVEPIKKSFDRALHRAA